MKLFIASLVICAASSAFGATISQTYSGPLSATFSGTLPNQGTALLENFTLPMDATLTAFSTSYATGGFSPNLILYDAQGDFVSASGPSGVADPNTGLIGDASFTAKDLSAGMYTLAITDFLLNQSITATNLSDGFTSNFGSGSTFVDEQGNPRTGDYSVTINLTTVPEPSALLLAGIAAASSLAIGFWRTPKTCS